MLRPCSFALCLALASPFALADCGSSDSSDDDGAGGAGGSGGSTQTHEGSSAADGASDGHGGVGGGSGGGAGSVGLEGTGGGGSSGTDGAAGGPAEGAAGGAGASAGGAGASGQGGSADPCAGKLVCDGFEGTDVGAPPGKPWEVHANKGSVVVDDTRAHSGSHSVKVSVQATTASDTYREAYFAVTGKPLIPLTGNNVYGRMMVYTDRIPDKTVHWTIAHGEGPIAGQDKLSATYNYGGMGGLMANYYSATSPVKDCWQSVQESLPTGRWVCVAWRFDGKADKMTFSVDGQDVTGLDVDGDAKTDATCTVKGSDGKWVAPAFQNISVGWESYQHDAMGAHDAWVDDVVLDSQPVGCP